MRSVLSGRRYMLLRCDPPESPLLLRTILVCGVKLWSMC